MKRSLCFLFSALLLAAGSGCGTPALQPLPDDFAVFNPEVPVELTGTQTVNGESVTVRWVFTYDAQGRVVREDHFSDGSSYATYLLKSYDDDGNLIREETYTDDVLTSAIEYDALGRMTLQESYGYQYTSDGGVVPDTSKNSSLAFTYDEQCRPVNVTETGTIDGQTISLTLPFTVDEQARTAVAELPGNDGSGKIACSFDDVGRFLSLTNINAEDEAVTAFTYEYDGDGNMIRQSITYPALVDQTTTTTYQYDENGYLTEYQFTDTVNGIESYTNTTTLTVSVSMPLSEALAAQEE